jgi:hypothetical protein
VILVLIIAVMVELVVLGVALVVFGLKITHNLSSLEDAQELTAAEPKRGERPLTTEPMGELELRPETAAQLYRKPVPIIDHELSAQFK